MERRKTLSIPFSPKVSPGYNIIELPVNLKIKYVYKMTRYTNVKVNISEGQKEKLQHTIKAGCPEVSIRLGHEDLQGNDILVLKLKS